MCSRRTRHRLKRKSQFRPAVSKSLVEETLAEDLRDYHQDSRKYKKEEHGPVMTDPCAEKGLKES